MRVLGVFVTAALAHTYVPLDKLNSKVSSVDCCGCELLGVSSYDTPLETWSRGGGPGGGLVGPL